MGGESSETLRFLLFLTPNFLIVSVIIAWFITAVETRTNGVSWPHWAVLALTTLLLPQLKLYWMSWRPLLRYLPDPSVHFPATSFRPLYAFFVLLPSIVASAAVFYRRSLSSYVLLTGGAVYILLVVVIIIFFNGGAMA
jgi:hypothetical protein